MRAGGRWGRTAGIGGACAAPSAAPRRPSCGRRQGTCARHRRTPPAQVRNGSLSSARTAGRVRPSGARMDVPLRRPLPSAPSRLLPSRRGPLPPPNARGGAPSLGAPAPPRRCRAVLGAARAVEAVGGRVARSPAPCRGRRRARPRAILQGAPGRAGPPGRLHCKRAVRRQQKKAAGGMRLRLRLRAPPAVGRRRPAGGPGATGTEATFPGSPASPRLACEHSPWS